LDVLPFPFLRNTGGNCPLHEPVAHTCYLSYSGGRDQEDGDLPGAECWPQPSAPEPSRGLPSGPLLTWATSFWVRSQTGAL
jgi:hypothetical protein